MNHTQWREQVEARKARGSRKPPGRGTQRSLLGVQEVEPPELVARFLELLPVARALVAGALGNHLIREYFTTYPHVWSEEKQRRHPTVRVDFEHTIVIGGVGEGVAAGKHKNWGPVLGVLPLEPDDPVDPFRLLYVFKDGNPYQRRFDQRKYMRDRMGAGFAKLVNRAMGATLEAFIHTTTAADVVVMEARLGVGVKEFWRAAKGKSELTVPTQRPLFTLVEAD